jgi:hypothetical protein
MGCPALLQALLQADPVVCVPLLLTVDATAAALSLLLLILTG